MSLSVYLYILLRNTVISVPQRQTMESVFNYLDYRDYLKDHFEEQKALHSFFSFRYLAAKIGIDASFYAKVLNKQKHLGENKIEDISDFLKLKGREREFFITLFRFNRAKSERTEKELFTRLLTLKNTTGKTLDKSNYRYFSEWFNIPIRELLNSYDFSGNYAELASKLIPEISEAEAKRAIQTLSELSLIEKDESEFYRPSESILTTGDQWKAIAIREFQKKMINHAALALDTIPPEDRDISSLTISTSRSCLEAIREKLQQARREILEMINAEKSVDGVYQINLQIFPLSKQGEE